MAIDPGNLSEQEECPVAIIPFGNSPVKDIASNCTGKKPALTRKANSHRAGRNGPVFLYTGIIKDKIPQGIKDYAVFIEFNITQKMGAMTDNDIGTRIDTGTRKLSDIPTRLPAIVFHPAGNFRKTAGFRPHVC